MATSASQCGLQTFFIRLANLSPKLLGRIGQHVCGVRVNPNRGKITGNTREPAGSAAARPAVHGAIGGASLPVALTDIKQGLPRKALHSQHMTTADAKGNDGSLRVTFFKAEAI